MSQKHNKKVAFWLSRLKKTFSHDQAHRGDHPPVEVTHAHPLTTFIGYMLSIGAFLAVIFLAIFIHQNQLTTRFGPFGTLALSASFMIISFSLHYSTNKQVLGLRQIFISQLSLAFMIAGKAIFCFVPFEKNFYDSEWNFVLKAAFITLATYPLYPSKTDRFLSSFITFALIFIENLSHDSFIETKALLVYLLVFTETSIATLIFVLRPASNVFIPLGYAAIVALLFQALFWLYPGLFYNHSDSINKTIISAIMSLGLIAILLKNVRFRRNTIELYIAAILSLTLLIVFCLHGVLGALFCILAGYIGHHPHLKRVGFSFLPVFIIAYYYSLEINLLQKSILLGVTGILLFIIRWYILMRFGNKKEIS